jgi:glycosyltransferase involved in cell wall biosynthesis
VLAAAFRALAERAGRDRVLLKVAGYLGERDRPFLDGVRDQIASWGLADRVEIEGEVDRARKIEFLRSLHVLSVPAVYREPKGLYVLEALANGVPVVEPRHGAFPEMIEATGGGILVEPDSADALAEGLATLMGDPERRRLLGVRGQAAVREGWTDRTAAEHVVDLYRRLTAG